MKIIKSLSKISPSSPNHIDTEIIASEDSFDTKYN